MRRTEWLLMLIMTGIVVCASSCSTIGQHNRIQVDYTPQILRLPEGIKSLWPNNDLEYAFTDYWSLRFSNDWPKAFEKEAPYFQEIVGRTGYENVFRDAARNSLEKLEIQSIQQINEYFYEIKMTQRIKNAKKEDLTLYITDRWVYAGQSWYHVIRDSRIFPKAS